MITLLLYAMIVSIFLLDFLLFRYGIGMRLLTWIPEMVSIIIAVLIPFKTAASKQVEVPIKYVLLLVLYLFHLGVGFVLNEVSGWTILSGLRIYTKFIPVFFIPLLFLSSSKDFKRLLLFLLFLSVLQFPVVLYQRFVEFGAVLSAGDPVGGTLGTHTSGVLSIFLLIVMSFLIAYYFKEELPFSFFILLFIVIFLPTTMNETKVTFLLLPITIIFPALFIKAKAKSIIRVFGVGFLLFLSFFALLEIYNTFQSRKWGYGIETFVAKPGRVEEYSSRRLDPIQYAISNATKDIRFFFFGRGAGNVSKGFTQRLDGKYVDEGRLYSAKISSFTKMMWEIGVLGVLLILFFPIFVFQDASKLCKQEGQIGAFSLGMLSCCTFFFLSFFYTGTFEQNVFVYLFFLTSGYIALFKYRSENFEDGDESYQIL